MLISKTTAYRLSWPPGGRYAQNPIWPPSNGGSSYSDRHYSDKHYSDKHYSDSSYSNMPLSM